VGALRLAPVSEDSIRRDHAKVGQFSAEKIVRHAIYGTPRKVLGIQDIQRKGTPRAAAKAFLTSIAQSLKLHSDLRTLKFDKVIESPLGSHAATLRLISADNSGTKELGLME
jgi:hypothetical protein